MTDKKAEILRCGKILFTEQGFKKTNVSQITEMAGMATGTFLSLLPFQGIPLHGDLHGGERETETGDHGKESIWTVSRCR